MANDTPDPGDTPEPGDTDRSDTDTHHRDTDDGDTGTGPGFPRSSLGLAGLAGLAGPALAFAKVGLGVATAPVSVPALMVAARRTAADCSRRIDAFPEHLHALAADRPSPLPSDRVGRLESAERWVITSDLHRGLSGRLDWPGRQGTKDLYVHLLEHYAGHGWGLIENGDVEDLWMIGASPAGAVADVVRVLTRVDEPADSALRVQHLAERFHRVVENNATTYEVLRDGFVARGAYHRTVGNHDEALVHPPLRDALREHLPGVDPLDALLLTHDDTGTIADVDAVVTHGHLTDSWNGPGYSPLGRAITWLLLELELPDSVGEGLPDEQAVERLLTGRGRNRLVTLDPRFGGNRRFDSLDEERLFARLARSEPEGGWPWMLFGHTHYPMLWPTSRTGGRVRYANSGCGVLDRAISALEWDPDHPDGVRLVLWVDDADGIRRVELMGGGASLRVA